jgi:GAF domain-containing protein
LRRGDDLLGALSFTSLSPVHYTSADVAVARRIGDYVALALSHQQLAEAARKSEELRARAATSDLLDELLASVSDEGELRDVFERVSAIGRRCCATMP